MAIYLLVLTTICAIGLVKLARYLQKRCQYVSIIDKIPGPKAYPIIGNAFTEFSITREDRYEWSLNFFSKYFNEGIFRTWLGRKAKINIVTAEAVGVVMSSRNLITKAESYKAMLPWLGTGLTMSTGDKWHRHRKLITPTFHFKILEDFTIIMSEKAEILKECIELELKNNPKNPIDVSELLTRCALDIICESAMGININAQTNYNGEYSMALHNIAVYAMERIFRPWLHPDWIFYRTERGKVFKRTVEIAHNFINQVISERKLARKMWERSSIEVVDNADKPKRQAFLDHLLDACDHENMPLTDEELREEVNTFMFAGHDTTAAAMSWTLFCIGNNLDVEEKIHEEQLRVFGNSKEPTTLQQLSELEYLERVMKEALRLFPSVPMIGRHATEDVEIGGYKIPKDTTISIHIFQIHRDPRYWPEPNRFDPDRFLPENSHGRHPHAYIPFSAGPRNCIGRKFAFLEEKTVLTALLRKWRVKSVLEQNEAKAYLELILRPQGNIKIYFTPK